MLRWVSRGRGSDPQTWKGAIGSGTSVDLRCNSEGALQVSNAGTRVTYTATILGLVPALTPTDIVTITGSASKTILVTAVRTSATRGVAGVIDIILAKRSTANTGGTSTAATAVPHDSSDAAATATVLAYTANPTTGTPVGNLRNRKMFVNNTAGAGDYVVWELADLSDKPGYLRGTSQVLAVNLNAVTITGGSFDLSITWIEEV